MRRHGVTNAQQKIQELSWDSVYHQPLKQVLERQKLFLSGITAPNPELRNGQAIQIIDENLEWFEQHRCWACLVRCLLVDRR
jgi:hypothetical protein